MYTLHPHIRKAGSKMISIKTEAFGKTKDGVSISRHIMENDNGMKVSLLDYGCVVQSIVVPGKNGDPVDAVLGYDDIAGYEEGSCFLGTFVGRYANRIKNSCFELNGRTYRLEPNEGRNHLHGTYTRRIFKGETCGDSVVFKGTSPDGEEGYPGNLTFEVKYTLTDDNALEIEYLASTDADTVLNFTNHSYFNLNGDGGDVLGHNLTLLSDSFTEGDPECIMTGNILTVDGTPMDFRNGKTIGQDIGADYEPLRLASGYDHNFILDNEQGSLIKFAECTGDKSGVSLECFTTQPGVQFYSGNFLEGDTAKCGKGGVRYPKYGGFCLETQHYPCSPNFPEFPSTVLHPDETYCEKTVYRFVF